MTVAVTCVQSRESYIITTTALGPGMNLQKQEVFPQNCPHNDSAAQTHSYNIDCVQGQMVNVLGCEC